MSPQRIQRQRTRGWRTPEHCRYVGRPTKFGNPYRPGEFGDWVAHRLFSLTARGIWEPSVVAPLNDKSARYAYARHTAWMKRIGGHPIEVIRAELAGWDLSCWCPLDYQWCHVGTLLEIAAGAS